VAIKNNNSPMSLEEFENKFRKKKRFDKYWYHGLCLVIIGFSLYVLYVVVTERFQDFSERDKLFLISVHTFLLVLGVYGLFVLRKKFKLTYWRNHFTKDENLALLHSTCSELAKADIKFDENSAYFVYQKKWWTTLREVYLFADHNLIAINVEMLDISDGGFIDFGASKKTQNRILHLMKEKASH
jgi:hypothetical protein